MVGGVIQAPTNAQAVMTHVAFTEHMLRLMELFEVVDG
jgi:hypothetical protein